MIGVSSRLYNTPIPGRVFEPVPTLSGSAVVLSATRISGAVEREKQIGRGEI